MEPRRIPTKNGLDSGRREITAIRGQRAFAVTSISCATGRPSIIVDMLDSKVALYTKSSFQNG